MTRVTSPRELAKLGRSLSSSASAPRPSPTLVNGSAKSVKSRTRKEMEKRTVTAELHTDSHRRPTPPSQHRTIPLMQTFFHTTPTARARSDTSSIDYAHLPSHEILFSTPTSSFGAAAAVEIRPPLLPDNFLSAQITSGKSHLAVGDLFKQEEPDAPLPQPEISVVAANPDAVLHASALTEVEGFGVDGVELGFVHELFAGGSGSGSGRDGSNHGGKEADGRSEGMVRDLWKGLVDDVLGGSKLKAAV